MMKTFIYIIFIGSLSVVLGCERKNEVPNAPATSTLTTLTDSDKYILEAIHIWVWSGFYTPDEVDSMIDDILESDANEKMLRDEIIPEFAKKRDAEKSWPKITDCDRLNLVFDALDKRGILSLHNSGYEKADGHQEAYEILFDRKNSNYVGYTFYHGQDVERAIKGRGLWLSFSDLNGNASDHVKIGLIVKEELERAGFIVEWDGTIQQRIGIPNFDWKRRQQNSE